MVRGALVLILVAGAFGAMLRSGPTAGGAEPASAGERPIAVERAEDSSVSGDAPDPTGSGLALERQPNGHFYADVQINGATVHMLVDTGASGIALSREDARSAGVATSIGMPDVIGEGADGAVHGEIVRLARVTLGDTTAEDMPAIVLNAGEQSLLGQAFLAKFASVEIRGDRMILR